MIKIEDELKNDFLDYATSVNNERAFPDARDSLKPVQRAILWDMYLNKYYSSKPHVKCAKISGSVIGHLHPHGDGAVYEALVRMSQDWIYHKEILPIDFHGAMGSRIGGPTPASSRYTEARLSKFSEDNFFKSIDKNVVDTIDNFSEDEKWPEVFPSIAPMLLLSQVSGIGYTIANYWLPHNLNEITEKVKEYVNKGKVSTENIYPDFPIGCTIINKKDCENIYKTGKGSVILRGAAEIEGKYINITELPYQVYVEPFIQKIKDLVNAGTLTGIEDICNKSGDNGLHIEIECSIDPKIVLNKLYKLTDLQMTFSANQMALVDGIPQMLNLENYIKVYVDHNINCLQREYKYDLDKATARLEIVEGLIRAIRIIDDVIKTIRKAASSDKAKNDLISEFDFTENQAKAIVDMRLGKLANLEWQELGKEQQELNKTIILCKDFLSNIKLQQKEFLKRVNEFAKKYGWERRTKVIDLDLDAEKAAIKSSTTQVQEKYMVCLTKGNTLKRVSLDNYKPQAKVTSEDNQIISAIEVDLKDVFILISEDGYMYKQRVRDITLGNMNSTGTLQDKKIVNIFTGKETEDYLFMMTKRGLAKRIDSSVVFNLSKNIGAIIMKVNEDDVIIDCQLSTDKTVLSYKYGNKTKNLKVCDFISKGRGAGGIVAIKLKPTVFIETN